MSYPTGKRTCVLKDKHHVALGTKFCLRHLALRNISEKELNELKQRFRGKGFIDTLSDGSYRVITK